MAVQEDNLFDVFMTSCIVHTIAMEQMYWEETALVVNARVQGLGSEEVSLEVRGSKLVLIVHDGVRRRCIQSCQLPENVNVGQSMTEINENGVLTVRVPKEKEPEPPKNKCHPPVVHAAHSRRGCFFC
ncbi:putative heat-shock protein [Tripterygium wilfordii]|uniref:Putative heat-shock protein n=1 Tax=Tripterygium wilfordii TaxID=458696 RepID=A0A7J7DDZ4_TRIWF|nr:17.6 kDa class I heat shock protein-like isoform X3 [Tripterygium wilfordii]KAF5744552.1 putative heat-shock protein [Tripterygium wilfordii]